MSFSSVGKGKELTTVQVCGLYLVTSSKIHHYPQEFVIKNYSSSFQFGQQNTESNFIPVLT